MHSEIIIRLGDEHSVQLPKCPNIESVLVENIGEMDENGDYIMTCLNSIIGYEIKDASHEKL